MIAELFPDVSENADPEVGPPASTIAIVADIADPFTICHREQVGRRI